MPDSPFSKITRTTRWQNRVLFGVLPLAIFLIAVLLWGSERIFEQEQGRLALNFSAIVGSLDEQEIFLRRLKTGNESLKTLPDQRIATFFDAPAPAQAGYRMFRGRESIGGIPFSLQCSLRIDCDTLPDRLFSLGSYLAAGYSSFWAGSYFPAAAAFFTKEDGAISIGVPAIDVPIGNESVTQEMFDSTIAAVKAHLRARAADARPGAGSTAPAQEIVWFRSPQFPEKMIGMVAAGFSSHIDAGDEAATSPIYAAILFSRQRISAIERSIHTLPRHLFWLEHRDFGVLMGTGPVPQVDEAGMRYTRNGLILKTEDASGRWTGYYQVDYATFFQGRLFAPSAGLVLALLLSLLAGIAYTRWFNRKVIAPAQEAQRVIVESNQFNRTLIETAPVAVCLVAYGSGKIIFSNSLVQEWLHSADGYLRPGSPENRAALDEIVNARAAGTMEQLVTAQGRTLYVAYAPTRYLGQDVTLCVFADVSARAEIESNLERARIAADEANEAKSTFLATMSHEIRTPLYGALGTLELLGLTELTQLQRKYVDRIEASSSILLQIISDILDTSKIEAGQLQLEKAPFNPRELVQNCTSSYAAMAQQNGLLLFSCVDAQVPESVLGDAVRIRQILGNLISNAIKFTEAGHVIVRLRSVPGTASQVRLVFEVCDTGVGIEKSLHGELFTPFYLVKNSSRTARGAGLGLSICWSLARMMSSSIEVWSEPGLGSRFWFELGLETVAQEEEEAPELKGARIAVRTPHPELTDNICAWLQRWAGQARAAGAAPVAADKDELLLDVLLPADSPAPGWTGPHLNLSSPDNRGIDGHNVLSIGLGIAQVLGGAQRSAGSGSDLPLFDLRVLVAEDNPVNQVTLRGQLESLGCEVTVADDGEEALALWDISPHDLVLTDVNMPYLNGYELAERLRAEGVACPIVGVTANAMLDEENRCLNAGMNAWLVKPIPLRTLVRTLEKFAPKKRLRPAPAQADTPAGDTPQPAALSEPNVLQTHRQVFVQCMNDDIAMLARGLDERRPDLAAQALHRMRGALLLARMQELAARTQSLEDQLPNGTREPGLQAALSVLLDDLLADLRAMMAQLPQP
ncbi:response regulator [Delftia acidovorans]